MTLINEVKQWYKLWSIQIDMLGLIWITFSDQIVNWWNFHATEYFPFLSSFAVRWIGLILLVASVVARMFKQEKLANANKQ